MTKVFDHQHALAAVEQRVGVESFEALTAERKAIQVQNHEDESLFGPNGLWDERRRALRGAIATEIRDEFRANGAKMPSESALEDAACADSRYKAALDRAHHGKMAYLKRAAQIEEINDRLRNREIILRIHMAETNNSR